MFSQLLPVPVEDTIEFLDAAIAAFMRARTHHPGNEYYFNIAGQIIHLNIVGRQLDPYLTPALMQHRIAPPDAPADLTLYAFDTQSADEPMPNPVWANNAYTSKEILAGFSNERIRAAYNVGTGVFNIQDTRTGRGLYWIQDAALHPRFEMSSPLRVQLYWWLRTRHRYVIHGGAVCQPNGGVMLVGRGGSGKSTSTLACIDNGWQFLGDDYIAFGLEPVPTAYNLYQSAKLNVAHFEKNFFHLTNTIVEYTTPDHQDKAILMLQDRFPSSIVAECPIRAIVLPRIATLNKPHLIAVDPQVSLAALAPSTLQQLPNVPPQDVRNMMKLVQAVPNYILEIGGSPYEIPGVLSSLVP